MLHHRWLDDSSCRDYNPASMLMTRSLPLGFLLLSVALSGCGGPTGPSAQDGPAVQLTANAVDPATVNAVSKFNSCQGHPFPETNSPNSAKNYFWPTSTNFSTTSQLRLFAVCDGTTAQSSNDTSANQQDRGQTIHLYCDNSSTAVRYFHVNFTPGSLGHVRAGDFLGFASMLGAGQTPATAWTFSSNFDVAVTEGSDQNTVNYFSKLSATALAAWAARGLTSIAQTINPGNPVCGGYNLNNADVFLFAPVL